tara:strand:- start:47 stop:469 length:423 start_codon:yes stop_codon:yes gene_type:complete
MYIYNVRIKKIIDGDTVKVDIDLGFDMILRNQNIRLFGIDAPESRTKNPLEKKYGLITKEIVESIMPVGSTHQMVSTKSGKGKFGRILGEFLINDSEIGNHRYNLNRWLVENHYAVEYDGTGSRDLLNEKHKMNRKKLND